MIAGLTLREEQNLAVTQIGDAIRAGHKRIILYAPTGFGKTEVSIFMMDRAAEVGQRVAMLLDLRKLVQQTSARLDKYRVSHAVIMAGSKRMHMHQLIHICSIQTLEKRGVSGGYKYVFVDECHMMRKSFARYMDAHPDVIFIGLSATPITKGLRKLWQVVVCPTTTNKLIGRELLVMPTIYCAKEIDMDGAKKVAGEWTGDEVSSRAVKITGDVVTTYREKTDLHFGGPVKSLIFAASVAHAAELATQFAAVGLNFCAISYKDDDDFKADVHAEFEKADSSIIGLIAVDMLTKGFDVAAIKCAVMARPFSKSVASIIQQIGREMRTAPGKDAAILIDHAGNFLRHGDQIFDIFENGITELNDDAEKPAKEKTLKEKEACKCPKCQALWRGATDTCSQCGYIRPSRSKVQQVAGTVEEFAAKSIARAERQDFYSQLLGLAQQRGYAEGWAAHKFKEKFESFPDGLKRTPTACGPKVAAYVKSRQIAWSHKRQTA